MKCGNDWLSDSTSPTIDLPVIDYPDNNFPFRIRRGRDPDSIRAVIHRDSTSPTIDLPVIDCPDNNSPSRIRRGRDPDSIRAPGSVFLTYF